MNWLTRLKTTQPAPRQIIAHDALIPATLAMQAANDPAGPALDTQPATLPTIPDKPAMQTFMEWQDAWLHLDRAYQAHHFKCSTCIAAGRGAVYGLRCGVGAALWTAYSDTS